MQKLSFARHRFAPELIIHAVWLYARFTLSYRDIEDLLAERGIDVSYETVRRWFLKFGTQISTNLRTNEENERCSVSNHRVPLNASSIFTQPHTTTSTYNAISTTDLTSRI